MARGWRGTGLAAGLLILALPNAAAPARAARASLVVEADSGAVLSAEAPNLRSFPASTTKMMTAYLAFEALAKGQMKLEEALTVSATAADQSGRVIGLKAGTPVFVGDAILAMLVDSANDAAVVLAERMAGSQAAFAERMSAKAAQLGMTRSRFRDASGLGHVEQTVTARDLAILARALIRDFPERYGLFATRAFALKGISHPTVNGFLVNYAGAEGMKTGFTCAAGFNLVATATRRGRRLIAVVLGESSLGARAEAMRHLMDAGFATPTAAVPRTLEDLAPEKTGEPDPPALDLALPGCATLIARADGAKPATSSALLAAAHPPSGWSVTLASAFPDETAANRAAVRARLVVKGGRSNIAALRVGGRASFHPTIVGLSEMAAREGCFRLARQGMGCAVVTPKAVMPKGALIAR